jgi:hypothetical protein
MNIANPIYDAAFKYLMDDKKIAMLVIGAITDFDIEDIELRPTETTLESDFLGRNLTVYRLDFAAKIRSPEGNRVILIEIQKAKFYTDILRFRCYLGSQYLSEKNTEVQIGNNGVRKNRALPLYSIYILGHTLDRVRCPVLKIKRGYIDAATGEEIREREEFIESLTHDSTIIQVPELKQRRRNRLERMLSVFDQALIDPDSKLIIHIREEDYPEEFRPIVRRLLRAIEENEVRKRMRFEDEFVSEIEARDRAIVNLGNMASEERRQKEEALAKLVAAVDTLVASGRSVEEARRILGLDE